jgi:hypothetical protein
MKNGMNDLKSTDTTIKQSYLSGNKALHIAIVMFGITLKKENSDD